MKLVLKAMIAIGMLALIGGVVLGQTGNDLFQQALVKERTEGNLAEAIKLYQTIVQKYGSDRKLAAKALFQIGQAYEKLGNAEARKAYERIAREFADQKDVAADAGRRLAALGIPQDSNKWAPRLITSGPGNPTGFGTLSGDGHWMAITDWETADGDLVVRELPTGQVKRLDIGTCGATSKTCGFAEDAVFSQDNRQVAYSWYEDSEDKVAEHLRVVTNEVGAKPRILLRSPQFRVWPNAWSSDGKTVFVHVRQEFDNTWQIGRVSVADGSVTVLKSIGWRIPTSGELRTSLSPDGRYLAYSILAVNPTKGPPSAPESTDRHIYLLATDGSAETEIVKTAAVNQGPLWTPDGAHIVFTSNLSGKSDLWAIAVRDGKAKGSPFLLRRNIGEIRSYGMTGSGSYSYVQATNSVEQISIAELMPGGESRIEETFVGINPSWSADGKSIAFSRHNALRGENWDLVVRSIETGDERLYTHDGLRPVQARWFHDSKRVLQDIGGSRPRRSNSIDLTSGEFRDFLTGDANFTGLAALSPDDKTAYFPSRDPKVVAAVLDRMTAIDLNTGRQRQIVTFPETAVADFGFAVSPDGSTLAIATRNRGEGHLALVRVDGTGYHEISAPFRAASSFGKPAWSKDGRSILFAENTAGGAQNWRIMRIGVEGGKPEFTGLAVKDLSTFDLSPNGSRIAFSTTARPIVEYWAIDNLPALLKNSQ